MKRLKKKNNPLWDRLLIEKNMKLFKKKKEHKDKYSFGDIFNDIVLSLSYKEIDNLINNMKLKTNKMKTCKDCVYYKKIKEDTYIMHCKYSKYNYEFTDVPCCGIYTLKNKPMKRNKQEINLIKEAYNSAEVNCDWKTKIKETFPDIKFERELPETWEEYCRKEEIENLDYNVIAKGDMSDRYNQDYRSFWGGHSAKITILDKYVALRKLELLRDHYNDGYNFKHGENKHVIWYDDNGDTSIDTWKGHEFLRFKTEKLAIQFLKYFKDLIEQAGDLI